jgi:hypothetical protein
MSNSKGILKHSTIANRNLCFTVTNVHEMERTFNIYLGTTGNRTLLLSNMRKEREREQEI